MREDGHYAYWWAMRRGGRHYEWSSRWDFGCWPAVIGLGGSNSRCSVRAKALALAADHGCERMRRHRYQLTAQGH